MKMKPPTGPKKQTQNKPNLVRRRRIANELKIACQKIRPHTPIKTLIFWLDRGLNVEYNKVNMLDAQK
jgi:hypothetical protein